MLPPPQFHMALQYSYPKQMLHIIALLFGFLACSPQSVSPVFPMKYRIIHLGFHIEKQAKLVGVTGIYDSLSLFK